MPYARNFRILGIALTALPLLFVSRPASAQTLTKVRVASGGVAAYKAGTCTAKTEGLPVAIGPARGGDSLVVVVEDDFNAATNPSADLEVTINGTVKALPQTEKTVGFRTEKAGELVGKSLTITKAGAALVCALAIPAEAAEDLARRPFRVGIGASFDFLNGVSATDLFADVTAHLPGQWDLGSWGSWGIDAGLFNGRTVASVDTLRDASRTFYAAQESGTRFSRTQQTYTRTATLTYEQIGQYSAPIVRLTNNLYWGVDFEGVKRRAVTVETISVTATRTDTVDALPDTVVPLAPNVSVPGDTTFRSDASSYERFIGTGPLVAFTIGGIEFRTKSMFRLSKHHPREWPYILQFRVTDFDNGFKIGGEIRKSLRSEDPNILVYLAKDFGFKRLADFLLGGDEGDGGA